MPPHLIWIQAMLDAGHTFDTARIVADRQEAVRESFGLTTEDPLEGEEHLIVLLEGNRMVGRATLSG